MIGYVFNDGGRKAAGFKGKKDASDCVTRAFAILTGRPYKECYGLIADENKRVYGKRTARGGVFRKVWHKVYKYGGLRKVVLPKGPRPTFTEAYERYGDCIVSTTHHVAAIVKGNLNDTFDCREYPEWEGEPDSMVPRKAMSIWVSS